MPDSTVPAARRTPAHRPRSPRRLLVLIAAVLLPASFATASLAATSNTAARTGGLTAAGPVDPGNGFPTWYQDSNNLRLEPCWDQENPLCGWLPGDIPDDTVPISFPDNFPEEFFYQLVGAELDLPGGGRAVLTIGLEGAFANAVQPGDQMVFARTRVVVKDAAIPNGELVVQHPYGTARVDIVGGDGRMVEDIGAVPGGFNAALAGKIGPFLKWTEGAPEGFVGNPDVEHAVTGGTNGNVFSVTGNGIPTGTTTDLFAITGKIAMNTGVQGDAAVVRGSFVDVYATSRGESLQVSGSGIATTRMVHDAGSERHYARVAFTGSPPQSIEVTNLSDKPASKATIKVSDITVTSATYDGKELTVTAAGSGTLQAAGLGALTSGTPTSFTVAAPPMSVTVTSAGGASVSYPVTVTGGAATPPGQPPTTPGTTPDCTNTGTDPADPVTTGTGTTCGNTSGGGASDGGTPGAPVAAVASEKVSVLRGGSVVLDGSTSTGAALTYSWTAGPGVTIANGTTPRATVSVPFAQNSTAPPSGPVAATPVVVTLTVTDSSEAKAIKNVTVTPPRTP